MYRSYDRKQSPAQVRSESGSKQSSDQHASNIAPPLSLQNLCLLEVINDLDSYPVELISSLPHWLRHRLLNNLPVLDLCRLDHTPVARGVDIDKIWTARVKNEPKIESSFLSKETHSDIRRLASIKSLFQMTVYQNCYYGLKENEDIARIAANKEMAFHGLREKKKFINDKEEYLMKLTAHALSCLDVREIAYRLAALRGSTLLRQLGITEENVWETQATPMTVLAMKRPRTTYMYRGPVDIFVTPSRLLPICETAELTELLYLLTHMCKIRPTSVCLDVDLISYTFQKYIEKNKIIMKSLLEDVVILRVKSQKSPHITGPMIALIEAVTGNGKLKSLLCSIPNQYMEAVQSYFSDLFVTKTFHMLHLELDDFSPQAMIKLLQAFMTSPCEAAQKLVIISLPRVRPPLTNLKQQITSSSLGSATVPECAVHHKTIQTNTQDHILLLLLLLPCVRLAELELHPTLDNKVSFFHLCACHPDLHSEKLKLNMYKLPWSNSHKLLDMTIANDLQTLLNKPTLQELHLTGNWSSRYEAKQGLIRGLQQQQLKPELQLKSITLNMLGYSDEDMRTLLEVIVSFPEDSRPRVYREEVFMDAAKKLSTDYTYDAAYIFQDGLVSRKRVINLGN